MLDDKQREIVDDTDGVQLVIAGSGAGKTRSLISRINHLVKDKKVSPLNILGISFTREAVREMQRRCEYSVTFSTLHSFCLKVIRTELKNFDVLSEGKRRVLIKKAIRKTGIQEYEYASISLMISRMKNRLTTHHEDKEVEQVYNYYELSKGYSIDFDDFMIVALRLLHDENVRARHCPEYLLIDEAHDLSVSQHKVIEMLKCPNTMYVSSPIQSIYSWRTASPDLIFKLEQRYPDIKVFKLGINYRCPKIINKMANRLGSHSEYALDTTAVKSMGKILKLGMFSTIVDECASIINRITTDDTGILYRTNWYGMYVERSLRKAGLRYRILGNRSFFNLREIQHMLAYIKLSINPDDKEAFELVYNVPNRYLGRAWKTQYDYHSVRYTIEEILLKRFKTSNAREYSYWYENQKTLASNLTVISGLCETPSDVINWVRDMMGYDDWLKKELDSEDDNDVLDNLNELTLIASEFEDKDKFLEECSAVEKVYDDDVITIGTIHQVKGLEFTDVFVVGLTEGIIPSHRSDDLDEERRLLYVAITRAKRNLTLSGAYHRAFRSKSRFLGEMK